MEGHVTFAKAGSIKVGDYLCIVNYPCKITHVDISKPGKHESSKMHFVGIDIITGKKHDHITPSSKDVSVPVIVKKEYLLMDTMEEYDDNGSLVTYCSLMHQNKTYDHIKLLDSDLGNEIKNAFDNNVSDDILISVTEVMGVEIISAFKLSKA